MAGWLLVSQKGATSAQSAAGGHPLAVLPEGVDVGTAGWSGGVVDRREFNPWPAMPCFTHFGPLWPTISLVAFHWALQQQQNQKELGQTQHGIQWLPHSVADHICARTGPGQSGTGPTCSHAQLPTKQAQEQVNQKTN